jgi:hypothetical protein
MVVLLGVQTSFLWRSEEDSSARDLVSVFILVFVSAAIALPSDECNLPHPRFFVDARSRNHLVQKFRQVLARVPCKNAIPLIT